LLIIRLESKFDILPAKVNTTAMKTPFNPSLPIFINGNVPQILSAPMAGFTNYAYRSMLRLLGGVDLIATEMVSARSFAELESRGEDEPSRLWGVREEARPLAVQIWDNQPETLAMFAEQLATDFKVSVIDLNFGCPARQIAGRSTSGSYLLQFPEKIADIVRQTVQAASNVPVSLKIRLGRTRDTINAVDVAQAAEDAGAAAITVHGRTAAQMYTGQADWQEIAKVKQKVRKIPVIANGDIRSVDDALRCLQETSADGIMLGRGSIAKPLLFRQVAQALRNEPVEPELDAGGLLRLIERHYELLRQQFTERTAVHLLRKHICHCTVSMRGARPFRNAIGTADDERTFFDLVNEFFRRGCNSDTM
jgi:tRNA-dihydrouridine synthase B